MDFEWDEAKRKANAAKHFIDFADAISIWKGMSIDPASSRMIAQETRHLALGTIGDDELVIAVIYTIRNETRRIISARRARRNERKAYQSVFGRGQ